MIDILEVRTRRQLREFVSFPNRLYRDAASYRPPLRAEDMADWNPRKNPAFEYCEARCWLARRDGKTVGRIGAILSRRANEKWHTARMRFTQVDFIDDDEVSQALFDTVENWAREMGMTEVHGPLGFTDLDREGMLIDGFDQKSMFITYYNYPYYIEHMARRGYIKDVDWVECLITIPQDEKALTLLERLSARVLRDGKLHVAQLKRRRDFKPYVQKVFTLINTCYAGLYGTVELSQRQVDKYADKFIPMINPELACFVMDAQEEMIAFGVAAPSMADAIKRHNGRLLPFGFIDVLKALRHNDTLDLYLIAVRPDYQNRGVNAVLINHVLNGCRKIGIRIAESGPQLENNLKVQSQWRIFEHRQHKRRRCFIKQLSAEPSRQP